MIWFYSYFKILLEQLFGDGRTGLSWRKGANKKVVGESNQEIMRT